MAYYLSFLLIALPWLGALLVWLTGDGLPGKSHENILHSLAAVQVDLDRCLLLGLAFRSFSHH